MTTATISISDTYEIEHCDACGEELGRVALVLESPDALAAICPVCACRPWADVCEAAKARAAMELEDAELAHGVAVARVEMIGRLALGEPPATLPTGADWARAAGRVFLEEREIEAARLGLLSVGREPARGEG